MQRIKMVSPVLFVITIICFFLPFININCAGEKIATLTGFQLMTGTRIESPGDVFEDKNPFQIFDTEQSKRPSENRERTDPEPLAIAAFVLAILGLILNFMRGRKSAIIPGIIGIAGLILLMLLRSKIDGQIADETGGALKVEYLAGYWIALIGFIAAALVNVIAICSGGSGRGNFNGG